MEYAPRSPDPEVLTAACRIALRRLIVQEIAGPEPELPVITLVTRTGTYIASIPASRWGDGAGIEPGLAERMQRPGGSHSTTRTGRPAGRASDIGDIAQYLAKFVKNAIPGLRVLSYQESA